MQVLSVRCGVTKNMGNYESKKLEIEAAPSDGQTADQLLAEVDNYLNKQLTGGGAPTSEPQSNKPPMASGKAASQAALGKPAENIINKDADKPKTTRAKKTEKPAVDPKALEKELRYTLEAESLEELAERFNDLRKSAKKFPIEQWDKITAHNGDLAGVYKKLQGPTANQDTVDLLVKAFKEERKYIEQQQQTAA